MHSRQFAFAFAFLAAVAAWASEGDLPAKLKSYVADFNRTDTETVTNAISSVIIVGAIFAATQHLYCGSRIFGFIAIVLASINIFGGFTITHRMLNMFQKK